MSKYVQRPTSELVAVAYLSVVHGSPALTVMVISHSHRQSRSLTVTVTTPIFVSECRPVPCRGVALFPVPKRLAPSTVELVQPLAANPFDPRRVALPLRLGFRLLTVIRYKAKPSQAKPGQHCLVGRPSRRGCCCCCWCVLFFASCSCFGVVFVQPAP